MLHYYTILSHYLLPYYSILLYCRLRLSCHITIIYYYTVLLCCPIILFYYAAAYFTLSYYSSTLSCYTIIYIILLHYAINLFYYPALSFYLILLSYPSIQSHPNIIPYPTPHTIFYIIFYSSLLPSLVLLCYYIIFIYASPCGASISVPPYLYYSIVTHVLPYPVVLCSHTAPPQYLFILYYVYTVGA